MNLRLYTIVSAVIFGLVALVHLARLIFQWDLTFAGHVVPMWASVVGIVVAGFLSFFGFRAVTHIQKYLT
jgi:hypothetical protein